MNNSIQHTQHFGSLSAQLDSLECHSKWDMVTPQAQLPGAHHRSSEWCGLPIQMLKELFSECAGYSIEGSCWVDVQVYADPSLVLAHITAVIIMLIPFHENLCFVLIPICFCPVKYILACMAKVFGVYVRSVLRCVYFKYYLEAFFVF